MGRKIRERGKEKTCFFGKAFFSKERFMLKDERGQLSIDFLVGISLFILALLFMAHFIPGMFVPFQTETIDLNSVAYRTSVILVEDPGWYNGTIQGQDWENDIANVSRVGLAIDKEHPNKLKMSKIDGFKACTNLTDKLGLYRMIGDNKIDYGYNITLYCKEWGTITRGKSAPSSGDVVKMKRIASVIVSPFGWMDFSNLSGASSPVKPLLVIDSANVSELCTQNLYISITNFSFKDGNPPGKFLYVEIVQTNLSNCPDCDLHAAPGTGLHISGGFKLNDPSDGVRQVKNHTGNITVPIGGLSDAADINAANDTLLLVINKTAFGEDRANFNLSIGDPGDVVIELKLNKINCTAIYDADNLLRYSATEPIFQNPVTLIVKVWT